MLTQTSLTDKKVQRLFFKSLPDSPLWHACLGTTRPHQCQVDIITVMPAAHWHVDGVAAGVHAADGGVAESRRAADGGAPGPSARWVHRTWTRSLFAAPYAGSATPVKGTAAAAAWHCGGGVQGPTGGRGVPKGSVGVGDDHWVFHALCRGNRGLFSSLTSKKSERRRKRNREYNKTKDSVNQIIRATQRMRNQV